MAQKVLDVLSAVLVGHWSHSDPEEILEGLTVTEARFRPPGARFSIYQELCHMELCQRDILAVLQGQSEGLSAGEHELWPGRDGPTDTKALKATIRAFLGGLKQAQKWVSKADQMVPDPRWEQAPISRALQVMGSHNSYHLGRITLLRAIYRRQPRQ